MMILFKVSSRVLVTETGFGLVIGFINHSEVVTTINYNTVTNFHSTSTPHQSSQSDLLFSSVPQVSIRCYSRASAAPKTVIAFTSPHLELNYLEYYQSRVI
jgi:hypothetical protein